MDLAKLNTATKYPSIPTFHVLGERGKMTGECVPGFAGEPVIITEKVDGTNARIVCMGDGDFFVGSREHLLYAHGDRLWSSDNGLVAAVMATGVLDLLGVIDPCVIYGEVYGGKINAAKEYTKSGKTGFRVFDVAHLDMNALDGMDIPDISLWREASGPRWHSFADVKATAANLGLECVPDFPALAPLPADVFGAAEWLKRHVGNNTLVSLDGPSGQMEGLVLRTPTNSHRVKLRTEDYRRALR